MRHRSLGERKYIVVRRIFLSRGGAFHASSYKGGNLRNGLDPHEEARTRSLHPSSECRQMLYAKPSRRVPEGLVVIGH